MSISVTGYTEARIEGKSLRLSIEGQAKARAALADHIPADEWIDEPI